MTWDSEQRAAAFDYGRYALRVLASKVAKPLSPKDRYDPPFAPQVRYCAEVLRLAGELAVTVPHTTEYREAHSNLVDFVLRGEATKGTLP